jgi:hypothetical protein
MIVKKTSGSQGKGVLKVDNRSQLEDIEDMLDRSQPLIFQEFLEHTKGRDIRVYVVGGMVVGAMMRIASKGTAPLLFLLILHSSSLPPPSFLLQASSPTFTKAAKSSP